MAVRNSKRMVSIDVLKGIAIVLVLLTHVNLTAEQKVGLLANFWIVPAVPIFMILSGYNYAQRGIKDYYTPGVFYPRLIKILLPWLIIFFVELGYSRFFVGTPLSVHKILTLFLSGGAGPGGYYIPMLFQILVFFPVVWKLLEDKNSRLKHTVFIFLFCLSYELVVNLLPLSAGFYRICFLRLMPCLVLGILLFHHQADLSKTVLPAVCFLGAMVYLYVISYTGYRPMFIRSWTPTSLFAAPYSLAIVYWFLKTEKHISTTPPRGGSVCA